jgi:gamma-aminobutyric acid type B receptor
MEQIDTVPISLVVFIFLLAASGIVFTIFCLIFNFVFRNKRYALHVHGRHASCFLFSLSLSLSHHVHPSLNRIIRISRPRLNYLILLGAVLFYVSMIPFSIPTTNEPVILAMVKTRSWLLSLGFSFFYGTIIMKMFRVYYIVHNPLPNKVKAYRMTLCVQI